MRCGRIAVLATAVVALGGVAVATGSATIGRGASRATAPARSMSIVAFGDWLPEYRVLSAAGETAVAPVRFDHGPLLAPHGGLIRSADLAICHMETPIGPPGAIAGFVGRTVNGRSLISAPYELAGDLRRVGFDRCTTASNHAYDLGTDGIASTLDALDAAGLSHDGTARTPAEGGVAVFRVNGIAVSHLSYALNSNTAWPSASWSLRRADSAATVRADVAEARRRGAEIVVVSLHVFVEMQPSPAPADRALVTEITRGGAVDTVVIHGPHVVQPLETVNGTPVFWSLGNHASGMGVPGRGRFSDVRALDGLAGSVRFTERADGGFDAEAYPVAICQTVDSRVVYAATESLRRPDLPASDRTQIEACVARTRAVVADVR